MLLKTWPTSFWIGSTTVAKLFPGRSRKKSPKIEIIPMVDVMFLLLVFYVLSSLALHHHHGVPVSLPAASTSEASNAEQELVISIKSGGEFFLNRQPVRAQDLGQAIAALPGGLERARKIPVVINADLSAQHRYVMQAMDELRKVDLNDFVLSTEPESHS